MLKSLNVMPNMKVGHIVKLENKEYVITSILQVVIEDGTDEPYIDFKAFLRLIKDGEDN